MAHAGLVCARGFCALCLSAAVDNKPNVALFMPQVIELPLKHPELFESLGIAQPKVRKLYS